MTLVIDKPIEQTEPAPERRSLLPVVYGVAAVLVLLLAVGVGILGYQYWDDRASEQAREEVVGVATKQAIAMLQYDFTTVDSELPKAADGLTGDFKDDFGKTIQQIIIPAAKEKQLTIKVSVPAAATVSASRNSAVVIVFVDQVTTSKDNPQAVATGSRLRIELQKVDGRWLVSQLTPI